MLQHPSINQRMALAYVFLFVVTTAIGMAAARTTFAAEVGYSVTDLGDLPGGGNFSQANAVNNSGQVAGHTGTTNGNRAFRWVGGTLTQLGDLPGDVEASEALGINNAGTVVGTSRVRESALDLRATLWDGESVIALGDLPGGQNFSEATAINDNRQVAGYGLIGTGQRAFFWDSGTMTDLGLLGGTRGSSRANDINNDGLVVGASATIATGDSPGASFRAFQWSRTNGVGVMTDLGFLPGGDSTSEATAVNDHGQIVGNSRASTGFRAFLYEDGVMLNLGDLPGGADFSIATGINLTGQVVGFSKDSTGDKAFLWDSAIGIQDLNSQLDETGAGWTLTRAQGINDSGQIVGYGSRFGRTRGFLLTNNSVVIPEPSAFVCCFGIGLAATVRRRRH